MDYKELLIKYIHHVDEEEGSDFLYWRDEGKWTDDEWAELQRLRRVEE